MCSNLNSNVYLSVIVLCYAFILHDACLRLWKCGCVTNADHLHLNMSIPILLAHSSPYISCGKGSGWGS